ncbi:MAG: hypothetical protein ACYC0V_16630 [Armatimonadota bacterium]
MQNNMWFSMTEDSSLYLDEYFLLKYPRRHTPKRYCSTCLLNIGYIDCGDICENPPPEVVKILRPYQADAPFEMHVQVGRLEDKQREGYDTTAEIAMMYKEMDLYNALSPKDFDKVADSIRRIMNMPDSRLILPEVHVGELGGRIRKPLPADFIYLGSGTIVNEKASEMLCDSGLTGFKLYPINVTGKFECKLFTLVVTGDGGVPKITKGDCEWRQCAECDTWYVWELADSSKLLMSSSGMVQISSTLRKLEVYTYLSVLMPG